MGQITPNMGIYIPAAGETNYDASFAAGMVNIDQHDHSGGPNKGVPIATSGIADGSVTYPKLNANVADNTTGIGTSGVNLNQLVMLGLLKNIFQISTAAGFISKNGSLANARTITALAGGGLTVTNGDGASADPALSITNFVAPTAFPTPTTLGGSISDPVTVTYGTRVANYSRVGSIVYYQIYMTLSAISNDGSGLVQIRNLPIASSATANENFMGCGTLFDGTDYKRLISSIAPGTTTLIIQTDDSGNSFDLLPVPANTIQEIRITGFYFV